MYVTDTLFPFLTKLTEIYFFRSRNMKTRFIQLGILILNLFNPLLSPSMKFFCCWI